MDIYTRTMLDDRGQRREVYAGRKSRKAKQDDRVSWEEYQELRLALGARDGRLRTVLLLSFLVFLIGAFSTDRGAALQPSALLVIIAFTVITAINLAVVRGRMPTRNQGRIRAAFLSLRRCPSCADQLTDPRSADGCFVCAHCGGAWRPAVTGDYCNCGYDLVGLEPNESGCIQCPECGRLFSATKAWAERYARPVADQHR